MRRLTRQRGSWADNGNNSGTFEFNPNCTSLCGGPRTVPVVFDQAATVDAAVIDGLTAEVAELKRAIRALALRKEE